MPLIYTWIPHPAPRAREESAFDSAAADRGGCKVFLCGRRLDDAELKAQLKRCVAPGYDLAPCMGARIGRNRSKKGA